MEDYTQPEPVPLIRRLAPFIAAFLIGGAGIGYAVHEHHSAQSLATQNQQMTDQLNATHSQLDALVARVNTLSAASAATPAETAPASPSPSEMSKPSPKPHSAGAAGASRPAAGHRANPLDPRFNKLQSQLDAQGKALDAQGKAIDDARSDLVNTRTELSGSIAKTHDELVVLEKKGERSYVEFDIQKSKEFKREGPLSVSLKKADVKHGFADLQLIVADRTLTQKHVNLYQPSMFYQPDSPQPIEIVINDISKDHIHGYISAPKYRNSELTASTDNNAGTPDGQAANPNPQLSVREKLPLPADNGPVRP